MKNCAKHAIAFISLISIAPLTFAKEAILEPQSWAFPEVIEFARKVSPNNVEGKAFNHFGLVYSFEHVASLKISSLAAEELQKYADIVSNAYPDAVAKKLPEKCDALPVAKLNETAVAGVAYISINATNPTARTRAAQCLKAIQNNFAKIGR